MSSQTNKRLVAVFVAVGIVFVLGASVASAQIWGKWGAGAPNVTCNQAGAAPCGFCDALMVVANVIDFATKMSLIIGAAMFAYGGIRLMVSAGSPEGATSAKKIIKGAIIGIVITLCAWLIVNTLLTFLSPGGDYSLTNPVQCATPAAIPFLPAGSGTPPAVGGGEGGTLSEANARSLIQGVGVNTKTPCSPGQTAGCVNLEGIRQQTINGVLSLKSRCGCTVFITGGTEGGHEAGTYSHSAGYKLDLSADQSLTNFIRGNASTFQYAGERGGAHGGSVFQDLVTGAEYVLETNPPHWDVTYR
jgi:hypothetical protein